MSKITERRIGRWARDAHQNGYAHRFFFFFSTIFFLSHFQQNFFVGRFGSLVQTQMAAASFLIFNLRSVRGVRGRVCDSAFISFVLCPASSFTTMMGLSKPKTSRVPTKLKLINIDAVRFGCPILALLFSMRLHIAITSICLGAMKRHLGSVRVPIRASPVIHIGNSAEIFVGNPMIYFIL